MPATMLPHWSEPPTCSTQPWRLYSQRNRSLAAGCRRTRCRNALVFAHQALLHRFFLDHGVDREVLADVAHEFEAVHAAEPVVLLAITAALAPSKAEEGLDHSRGSCRPRRR